MLSKLICWLIGHSKYQDLYSGQNAIITSKLTGEPMTIPLMYRKEMPDCQRCGKKLEES